MENHHAIHGKNHFKSMVIFHSYVTNYQRIYPHIMGCTTIGNGQWSKVDDPRIHHGTIKAYQSHQVSLGRPTGSEKYRSKLGTQYFRWLIKINKVKYTKHLQSPIHRH